MDIFKKAPDSEDIKFMEDGSWEPLVQMQETLLIATPDKPEKRPSKGKCLREGIYTYILCKVVTEAAAAWLLASTFPV